MSTSKKQFLQFNTGRPYTEAGQIIQCAGYPDYNENFGFDLWEVHFHDVSRGIRGYFVNIADFSQSAIMRAYDNGGYNDCTRFDFQQEQIDKHFKEGE